MTLYCRESERDSFREITVSSVVVCTRNVRRSLPPSHDHHPEI